MNPEQHRYDGSSLVFGFASLGNGYRIAECIDTAGEVGYWLLRLLCPGCEASAVHGSVGDAHHEALGLLPDTYRLRVLQVPLRCAMPRRDGRPCRVEVHRAGDACRHHRHVAATSTATDPTGE